MLGYLLLLFTVVPLVELALLIWIGQQTAWWLPIAMVLVTGISGAALARWQGWRAMRRIQDDMRSGRIPADAVIDGVMILVAGILLVTPGVLTDAVGLALLIPPMRMLIKRTAIARLRGMVDVRSVQVTRTYDFDGRLDPTGPSGDDTIIDAKVVSSHTENAK